MENDDNTTKNAIEERLNRIKNKMNSDQMKNMDDEELANDAADQSSKSLDLNKLKEKVKIDNAPELKGVKEIDKNIQQKKNEFNEASNTTITKEKFLNFIKQANDMFKNYEKQLQYYSMYSGKYNTKDLSLSVNIKDFCILADKKKVFESELSKLNADSKNPDLKAIKKLYQEKVDTLFKENKNLSKVMEKMSNDVVLKFQNRIQELFDENTKLKKLNGDLEAKLMKVKFIFSDNDRYCEEMEEKNMEIVDLNKQQILYMNKYEKATVEINNLTDIIKMNNADLSDLGNKFNEKLNEIKKLKATLEERENTIKEKEQKIQEQDNQIKLLYDDSIQWEQKFNQKVKENDNFKKWAMWDQDLIESFRKIEKLTTELNETKTSLDKNVEENKVYKEENQKLSDELNVTKKSEESLKKENAELLALKPRNEELEEKLKDYLEMKKQNETYKKELPAMKDEYESRIINDQNKFDSEIQKLKNEHENNIKDLKTQHNSEINSIKESHQQDIDKLNEKIDTLKEETKILKGELFNKDKSIEDLTNQIEKKNEVLSNLKKSYDNMINKLKVSEEKLAQYEANSKKH
jgi:chromosome segregation ATPase